MHTKDFNLNINLFGFAGSVSSKLCELFFKLLHKISKHISVVLLNNFEFTNIVVSNSIPYNYTSKILMRASLVNCILQNSGRHERN